MKYANSPDPQEMEQEISQSEQETEKDASHEKASQEPETSTNDMKEQGKDEKQSKTAKSTTTIEARIVHEETYPTIEGFGEEEAKAMRPIMQRFLDSYAQKPKDMTDEEWLRQRLAEELTEKSEEEIREMAHEIVEGVEKCDKRLASINAACDSGKKKEEWFLETVQEAAIGVNVNAYGNYLANIDLALYEGNLLMDSTIRNAGSNAISQCYNLDGFIAEQAHVNSFNANAALENSEWCAEVKAPGPGQTYGKNSVDIKVVNNRTGETLRYQCKFGKDAKATIAMLKRGNYNNQRFLVPTDQVNEVQKAFPGKTVTDHLGGTDEVSTRSKPMTKEDVKKLQAKAQEKGRIQSQNWNAYNTRDLALHLGKNAALAGAVGATMVTGVYMAKKAFEGEEIKANEVVDIALRTGADAGVKTAAAGALTVGVEKGMVPVLANVLKKTAKWAEKGNVIAAIACVGIENVKIMMKVASGEISGSKGLDLMARTSTSMIAGLVAGGFVGGLATLVCPIMAIPLLSTTVGGLIGGMVGYAAGAKIGELVYDGAKAVVNVGKKIVKGMVNGVKAGFKALGNVVSSAASAVGSAIGSVASGIGSAVSSVGSFVSGLLD